MKSVRWTWACGWFCGVLGLAAALPADSGEAEKNLDALYGSKIRQALATPDRADDLALAGDMISTAALRENDPPLMTALCQRAYLLSRTAPEGLSVALRAMQLLGEKVPAEKSACLDKIVLLYQAELQRTSPKQRPHAARDLLESLLAAADARAEAGRYGEAAGLTTQALSLALSMVPREKDRVQARLAKFQDLQRTSEKLKALERRLAAAPTDVVVRNTLVDLYLVEMDAPAKASELLTTDCDEQLRTYVPMAVRPAGDLEPSACVELGDWYRGLTARASASAKLAMLKRAHGCYREFFSHTASLEGEGMRAQAGLEETARELAKFGVAPAKPFWGPARRMSEEILAFARARQALLPGQQIHETLEKLREVNHNDRLVFSNTQMADGKVALLDLSVPGGGNPNLVNLDPLYGLPLEVLNLRDCHRLEGDLSALAGMKLRSLNLRGCARLDGLTGIQGMPLETLNLPPLRDYAGDLSFLRGFKTLKRLDIFRSKITGLEGLAGAELNEIVVSECPGVSTLNGLAGLKLEKLTINRCPVGDLGVIRGMPLKDLRVFATPLRGLQDIQGLPLESLVVADCGPLDVDLGPAVAGMKLTFLDVQGSPKIRGLAAAVRGMPLKQLRLSQDDVENLSFLRGLPVQEVRIDGTRISSLAGLEGGSVNKLVLENCQELKGDLSGLQAVPINDLRINRCPGLVSLAGLGARPMINLYVTQAGIENLQGLPKQVRDLRLAASPKLTSLRGVEGANIAMLRMTECHGLTDLVPLKEAKLSELHLTDCANLANLEGIETQLLTRVTVANCPKLTPRDYMLLGKIATLQNVATGDAGRDAEILQAAQGSH